MDIEHGDQVEIHAGWGSLAFALPPQSRLLPSRFFYRQFVESVRGIYIIAVLRGMSHPEG